MQVCLRLCGWILTQQDEIQIWLWIELKIDYHCSEGRNLDVLECPENYPQQNQSRKNSANAKK